MYKSIVLTIDLIVVFFMSTTRSHKDMISGPFTRKIPEDKRGFILLKINIVIVHCFIRNIILSSIKTIRRLRIKINT